MGFLDSIKALFGMPAQAAEASRVAQQQVAEVQQGLGAVDMSQPQWEPIEGITLDQYAEISGKMAKAGVMGPEAVNSFVEGMGVPEGKWQIVQNGWTQRMSTNRDVMNRYGMLYSQAMT